MKKKIIIYKWDYFLTNILNYIFIFIIVILLFFGFNFKTVNDYSYNFVFKTDNFLLYQCKFLHDQDWYLGINHVLNWLYSLVDQMLVAFLWFVF